MTEYYVNSAQPGSNTAPYDTWAKGALALATIFNIPAAAGDHSWAADDHAETQATAMTLTSPGTAGNPCSIFCARRTGGSTPPVNADLRATATISTTVASPISFNGFAYYYGIIFSCASGGSLGSITLGATNAAHGLDFDNCAIRLGGSNTSSRILLGTSSATGVGTKVRWKNTTCQFASSSQGINLKSVNFEWVGGSVTGATLPTTLFLGADINPGTAHIRCVDFNSLSGKTLCAAFFGPQRVVFEDCKLPASITISAQQTHPGAIVDLYNCDNGSVNYRNERFTAAGNQTTETVIIPTGTAAVDYASDGTTGFSWKIDTTGGTPSVFFPFESQVIDQCWINSTGSAVSQTFDLVYDSNVYATAPTDQDIWIEYEYLGTSGNPLGIAPNPPAGGNSAVATTFGGFFPSGGTGTTLTASTKAWTTTTLTTPVTKKITISFTPQLKGKYRAVLKCSRAMVFYVEPPPAAAA